MPLKEAHRPAGLAAVGAGPGRTLKTIFSRRLTHPLIVPSLESHISWGYFPPPSGTAGGTLPELGSAGLHCREVGVGLGLSRPALVAQLSVVSCLYN